MFNDLLNGVHMKRQCNHRGCFLRSCAGILLGPVAFVTLRASSTAWTSLTVSVNSVISGETDWLFPEDFQHKILTAYHYLGQRVHWLILASRLDQELYAIWNSA